LHQGNISEYYISVSKQWTSPVDITSGLHQWTLPIDFNNGLHPGTLPVNFISGLYQWSIIGRFWWIENFPHRLSRRKMAGLQLYLKRDNKGFFF